MSALPSTFPLAGGAILLRAATEPQGNGDFIPLWPGQAAALARKPVRSDSAADFTRCLAQLAG